MPSSLQGNPLAFLRAAGGSVAPPGPTAMGGAPPGGPPGMPGANPMDALDGGGGGDDQGGGGPLPPEIMQMMLAQKIAPQILAQQKTDYYKKFLKKLVDLLSDLRRAKGLGPHTAIDIGRAQAQLMAAISKLDKEKPEEEAPVQSLLAQGMMDKPMMASPPMNALPIMR